MTESKTSRIVSPVTAHQDVKAEAARHGIRLDEAFGMCIAYLCAAVVPLSWLDDNGPILRDCGNDDEELTDDLPF